MEIVYSMRVKCSDSDVSYDKAHEYIMKRFARLKAGTAAEDAMAARSVGEPWCFGCGNVLGLPVQQLGLGCSKLGGCGLGEHRLIRLEREEALVPKAQGAKAELEGVPRFFIELGKFHHGGFGVGVHSLRR